MFSFAFLRLLLELNFSQQLISHLHFRMRVSVKGRLKEREQEVLIAEGSGFYTSFTFWGEAGTVGVGACCFFDSNDIILKT